MNYLIESTEGHSVRDILVKLISCNLKETENVVLKYVIYFAMTMI